MQAQKPTAEQIAQDERLEKVIGAILSGAGAPLLLCPLLRLCPDVTLFALCVSCLSLSAFAAHINSIAHGLCLLVKPPGVLRCAVLCYAVPCHAMQCQNILATVAMHHEK